MLFSLALSVPSASMFLLVSSLLHVTLFESCGKNLQCWQLLSLGVHAQSAAEGDLPARN
jgi:hypothetical protein